MKYSEVLDQLPIDRSVRRVYGEPYETSDGAPVIPVARIRAGRPRCDQGSDQGSGQDAQQDAGAAFGINAVPLGVRHPRGRGFLGACH